jgi:hypothetical protein
MDRMRDSGPNDDVQPDPHLKSADATFERRYLLSILSIAFVHGRFRMTRANRFRRHIVHEEKLARTFNNNRGFDSGTQNAL